MKILHAPVNIANQGWLLAEGQRRLGHDARLYASGGFPGYAADRTLDFATGTRQERLVAIFRTFTDCLEDDFDVYHFYYHASLLPKSYRIPAFLDVEILRGMGRRVFFHLVGCDFRLPALSFERNPTSMCVACRGCLHKDKLGELERILELASGVFIGGPHAQRFIGDAVAHMLPVAVDLDRLAPGAAQRRVPRIVHMPTNRAIKGTDAVLDAIDRVRTDGVAFEFELIEGRSHDEAIATLRDADILIDQTGSDFYATSAIEAMAMGRVVMTGMLPEARGQLGEDAPVVPIDRHALAERLRETIDDLEGRRRLAADAQSYVRRHHSHLAVAKSAVEAYDRTPAPVPAGKTAASIVGALRAEMTAAQPAFTATAGSDGKGVYRLPQEGGTAAQRGTAPGNARYTFPEDEVDNPRLLEPLHVRFTHGLEEYVEDKYLHGRSFYRAALDDLGVPLEGPVLDTGCGPAQWSLVIASDHPGLGVTACDRNDFLLSCAREQQQTLGLANLEVVKGDMHELPFPDKTFRTTLCIGVLQLVRVRDAMRELRRVTAPGGTIIINVPGLGFYLRNIVGALRARNTKIAKQNLKFIVNTMRRRDNRAFTMFTRGRLRRLARDLDLDLRFVRPTGLYPPQKPRYLLWPVNMYAALVRPAGPAS